MYPRTLTISSVGQITLPKKIRELLGVGPGAKLEVEVDPKNSQLTLKRQKTLDEIFAELDEIDKKYPTPKPDPRARRMTVGEMSLEQAKHIEGDTWV